MLLAKYKSRTHKTAQQYRDLIRREAAVGGQLFGQVPDHIRREFVCLNKNTWLWHEEWVDSGGVRHSNTTRYDVRRDGIYKMQDGASYQPVSPGEARHLRDAATLYHEHVRAALYT